MFSAMEYGWTLVIMSLSTEKISILRLIMIILIYGKPVLPVFRFLMKNNWKNVRNCPNITFMKIRNMGLIVRNFIDFRRAHFAGEIHDEAAGQYVFGQFCIYL